MFKVTICYHEQIDQKDKFLFSPIIKLTLFGRRGKEKNIDSIKDINKKVVTLHKNDFG
jgi:hypothetical protein